MKHLVMFAALGVVFVLGGCAPNRNAVKPQVTIRLAVDSSGNNAVDPDEQKVIEAVKMIRAGRIQLAIDGPLDAVVKKYESMYAGKNVKVFSAAGMQLALFYAADTIGPGKAKAVMPVEVLGPAWAMAYWARGYAYNEMARYDMAKIELDKALALSPVDSQYTNELAYAYQMTKDWDKALALYKESEQKAALSGIEVSNRRCVAFRGEGYALVELHKLDEATQAYDACLKLQPGEPKSLGELDYIKGLRARMH